MKCECDKKKWCAVNTKRKQMSRRKMNQKQIARENNCEFVSKRGVAAAVAAMDYTHHYIVYTKHGVGSMEFSASKIIFATLISIHNCGGLTKKKTCLRQKDANERHVYLAGCLPVIL